MWKIKYLSIYLSIYLDLSIYHIRQVDCLGLGLFISWDYTQSCGWLRSIWGRDKPQDKKKSIRFRDDLVSDPGFNSLLTDAADVHFKRLQSVQNAAARLVSGACCYDHITPVLTTLHWLPVRKRVMFKTVVLVWKCLNGTAPGCLSELCVPVASASGRQHLRSASIGLLQVPTARTMIGRRSFAVAGPSLSNSFPAALRRPEITLLSSDNSRPICSTSDDRRTEVTSTTARCCCDVFRDSGAGHKTADLLTYLFNL